MIIYIDFFSLTEMLLENVKSPEGSEEKVDAVEKLQTMTEVNTFGSSINYPQLLVCLCGTVAISSKSELRLRMLREINCSKYIWIGTIV